MLATLAGCQKEDPFYSRNRTLIELMDAQDGKTVPAEKYVVRGEAGHLFYLEDLRAAVVKWASLDANVRLLAGFSETLKSRGIRLLIVPVPTKVETYPELLRGRPAFDMSPSKNRFLRGLDSAGVGYLDLRKTFYRAKGEARLFPRTDTHWDQAAIRLAAQAIAAWVHPDRVPAPEGKAVFVDTLIAGFQGDLAEKFRLDPGTESDTLSLKMVEGDSGRYREPDSFPVFLYGDSFLNQYKRLSAHLGAHLSRELDSPVASFYSLAGFTHGPERILGILAAHPEVKTAIWVFTSRTLMETAQAGP